MIRRINQLLNITTRMNLTYSMLIKRRQISESTVDFHLYKYLKLAKLIYGDRN